MSQFTLIAKHYDDLMACVGYQQWVDYIEEILKRLDPPLAPNTAEQESRNPTCNKDSFESSAASSPSYKSWASKGSIQVIDLACGTGNVSEILASRGFNVVGVDISPEMIEVARTKKGGVEYYVQDLAELSLNRKFDLAVCLFDSLNYIIDPERAALAIKRVGAHLVPGGVFIFDVNTIYALSHRFFDQAFLAPDVYPRYIWNSHYDPETRICRIDMLFEVIENGVTKQFKEVHYQRGHSIEELTQWLVDGGFKVVDIFHAYKFRKPTRHSDRVFFVARKIT